MRNSTLFLFGLLWWQAAAPAQTINDGGAPDGGRAIAPAKTGVIGADVPAGNSSYTPLTSSERLRMYFAGAFGPGAIVQAAASAGIAQWNNSPKEWKQGAEAYGERVGNSFARHVIRKTLESGAGAILHEDDRYFRSTERSFGKRAKHALVSLFVARNQAGNDRLAYARIGAAAGTSFISRVWQPASATTAGDAAVNFGVAMAIDAGFNVFKEFRPSWLRRRM